VVQLCRLSSEGEDRLLGERMQSGGAVAEKNRRTLTWRPAGQSLGEETESVVNQNS